MMAGPPPSGRCHRGSELPSSRRSWDHRTPSSSHQEDLGAAFGKVPGRPRQIGRCAARPPPVPQRKLDAVVYPARGLERRPDEAAAGPADRRRTARLWPGLEHHHAHSLRGRLDRGGQARNPGAHHDGIPSRCVPLIPRRIDAQPFSCLSMPT